jgi:hypothetical protein
LRWILLIAVVFGLCGGIAISYWRQSNVDVSFASIMVILVLLPSVVVAGLYGLYRFKTWLKERRTAALERSPDTGEMSLVEHLDMPWLHIYAVAVQTQLGHHADQIIAGLQQFRAAECDDELLSANGSKLLSRRIDLVLNHPADDSETDSNTTNSNSLSVRALRIAALTQTVYEQLDPVLATIAEGMLETPLWQLPNPTQQAILHPAWQGKEAIAEQPLIGVEPKTVWPKILKVLYLLPHHLELQDQQYLHQIASAQMMRYGFNAEQIQWTHGIVKDADETLQYIEQAMVAQLAPNESSILLVMGMDSHLDQALIDQQLHENPHFIPTEASFALLMTRDATPIPSLPVLCRITIPILKKRQKPLSAGGQLGANDLNRGLDELRRHYLTDGLMGTADLIPDTGLLVSDINPAKNAHSRELSLALRPFDFSAEDLLYIGSLLETTDAMASGLALAIALQQAESSKIHVPVICSAGNTLRGLWLAAPYSQNSNAEPLAASEPSLGNSEHV